MTEEKMRAEIRLLALENLMALTLATQWLSLRLDEDEMRAFVFALKERAAQTTFEDADPAASDMLASEYEEAFSSLIDDAFGRWTEMRLLYTPPR